MYVSKCLGVSQPAIEILNDRWALDKFGLRNDPATIQLVDVLPNTIGWGLWRILFQLYILHKIAAKCFYIQPSKQTDTKHQSIQSPQDGVLQWLTQAILVQQETIYCFGTGFDIRCFGHFVSDSIAGRELDNQTTQTLKK